tara:strand:+ start:51 stop:275 length:225 start_codon:yes stop_codon:yes gene_type:complete
MQLTKKDNTKSLFILIVLVKPSMLKILSMFLLKNKKTIETKKRQPTRGIPRGIFFTCNPIKLLSKLKVSKNIIV